MNFDLITKQSVRRGQEYTIVRPGITLCLFYAKPAETLAPIVANILEEYMNFIPDGALQTYLSPSGAWKKATNRTFNSTLNKLRSVGSGGRIEFYFGQEPFANIGQYGANFKGSPLADEFFPKENSVLYLEFPTDFPEFTNVDEFIEFVVKIAGFCEFDSGYCGYAFKHQLLTFRNEAFKEIGRLAMRFIGFDVYCDTVRLIARGHVCNISWLTLFGSAITQKLGGITEIKESLQELNVLEAGSGVIVRANDMPIIGDVNRGANDVVTLRRLAEFTKKLRVETPNLGPDDPDFAQRWLSRFDQ